MTNLGLGKKYDLMRDQNREHNRIAISLREHPIICSQCIDRVIGYNSTPGLYGICQDCKIRLAKDKISNKR